MRASPISTACRVALVCALCGTALEKRAAADAINLAGGTGGTYAGTFNQNSVLLSGPLGTSTLTLTALNSASGSPVAVVGVPAAASAIAPAHPCLFSCSSSTCPRARARAGQLIAGRFGPGRFGPAGALARLPLAAAVTRRCAVPVLRH